MPDFGFVYAVLFIIPLSILMLVDFSLILIFVLTYHLPRRLSLNKKSMLFHVAQEIADV